MLTDRLFSSVTSLHPIDESTQHTYAPIRRHDRVIDFLGNEDLTLTDIAFLLGFSEQSSFTRTFKRWTGQAPNNYRRLKKQVRI